MNGKGFVFQASAEPTAVMATPTPKLYYNQGGKVNEKQKFNEQ